MFCCIHVPDFPAQAALLRESKALPVALLDGPESLLKVVACNAAARRDGVSTGMTKLQAEVCGVGLIRRVQEQEDMAQAALIGCAYHFSPKAEDTAPGTIIIDLTGSERLLGTGRTLAEVILEEVTSCGFEPNVSLASNPDTAHYAACGFQGITIIGPHDEAKRLGILPVEVLDLEPEILEVLDAWGIKTFRELAALPSVPLTERLGQHGLYLQRLAMGTINRELVPASLPEPFQESMELEEAVELLEPLSFVLNDLLGQLMRRLIERSLATDQIEIDFSLEVQSDQDIHTPIRCTTLTAYLCTIKLPVPTQDAKVLLKLLQLDLAAHPPCAPVKKIKIEAIPARIQRLPLFSAVTAMSAFSGWITTLNCKFTGKELKKLNPTSSISPISIRATGVSIPGALDRQHGIVGFDQETYSSSHVLCIGAGGLMSNIAPALVRKGIGRLTILDHDEVEASNLNRQRFYPSDIGQNKAVALVRNLQRECTYSTALAGYAMSFGTAMHDRIDLSCDLAVCAVDNSPTRVTASRYFRHQNTPVIFTAVSADTDHGYAFIQKPCGPCIACLFPDVSEDESFPCPGTPAIADILQSMGALAAYAIDSILMGRKRSWNYRAIHLCSGEWDTANLVSRNGACNLCAEKENQ